MTDTALPPLERPRRLHFDWVLPTFFNPAAAFTKIGAYAGDAWLTPLLVWMAAELGHIWLAGNAAAQAALNAPLNLPADFANFPPDMQQQILEQAQANQATGAGIMLTHIFPGVLAVLGVWVGWLLLSAVLHLALTLLGGRSAMRNTMNVVAWASLPFVIRAVVRIGYYLTGGAVITAPGLAGFAPEGNAFLTALLSLVDVYACWQVALLLIGARKASGLAWGKVIGATVVTVALVLALQALPGFVYQQLSGLTTTSF